MPSPGSVSAITLGSLVTIVAGMNDVPTDRLDTLRGRFRNFSKLGFPNVASEGAGRRAAYWPEHVALVVVAFELVRFRVPQTAAALAVVGSRATVLEAVGDAARRSSSRASDEAIALRVESNALLEDAKRPELSNVRLVREGTERRTPVGLWRIDADRLVERAIAAGGLTDEPIEQGFFAKLTAQAAG